MMKKVDRTLYVSDETLKRMCKRCKTASIRLDKKPPCECCEVYKRIKQSEKDIYDKVKDILEGGDS